MSQAKANMRLNGVDEAGGKEAYLAGVGEKQTVSSAATAGAPAFQGVRTEALSTRFVGTVTRTFELSRVQGRLIKA